MLDAGELCNREVVIAGPNETLVQAAQRMSDQRVGSLVVVEGEPGRRRPIGLLTDRDIVVFAVATDGTSIGDRRVSSCMNPNVVTAHERDELLEVIRRLRSHGIRRIPVVDDDGILQGILSVDDVLDVIADELGELSALLLRKRSRETTARP